MRWRWLQRVEPRTHEKGTAVNEAAASFSAQKGKWEKEMITKAINVPYIAGKERKFS